LIWSARNGWLNQTSLIAPLPSSIAASKIFMRFTGETRACAEITRPRTSTGAST